MQHRVRRVTGPAVVAVLTLALAACAGSQAAAPKQDSKVTQITVVSGNNPWVKGIQKHLADYKAQTGVDVKIETYGNEQLNDQYKVKLNSKDASFDVMVFQVQDVMREFSRNGWLADVSGKVGADASWKWDDVQQAARDAVTLDGKVYGVPLMTERHVLYYRKDLLAAAGIAVPKTLDELVIAAKALNKPDQGIAGIAMRGQAVQSVTQFSSFLYSYGGDFQKDGKATVDTPEAVKAYETYGQLLRDSGPKGATSMGWVEASALFAQGKAAFYLDADSQAYTFLDPKSSAVVDKVDYAPFPAGPAGSHPYSIVPWTAGINQFSTKQDAAWNFIQWATSPQMFKTLMSEDTVPSPRQSSWDDPSVTAKFPAGLVANVKAMATTAVGHDRPQLEQVAKAREFVGAPVVTAIEGGDVAAAAAAANKGLQDLLDQDGK